MHRSQTTGKDDAASRTSWTGYLPAKYKVVRRIGRRLAAVVGARRRDIELQVARYRGGEQHKWHYDALGEEPARVKTVLTYLSDGNGLLREGFCGGSTAFRAADGSVLHVFPEKGTGLMWDNLTA